MSHERIFNWNQYDKDRDLNEEILRDINTKQNNKNSLIIWWLQENFQYSRTQGRIYGDFIEFGGTVFVVDGF